MIVTMVSLLVIFVSYDSRKCSARSFSLLALNALPEEGSNDSTEEWANDEYPYVLQSLATNEECRTDRACRVYRSTGEVDAHEVDEDE